MDAATFCGSGALACRLDDFLAENLDTGEALASLSEEDLNEVNGAPLTGDQRVRRRASIRALLPRRPLRWRPARLLRVPRLPATRTGGAPTRLASPPRLRKSVRGGPQAGRRQPRSSCPPLASARIGCPRLGAWAPPIFAQLTRSAWLAQEALALRTLLYNVRVELLASKGDLVEDNWGTLSELKAQAVQSWCARACARRAPRRMRPRVPLCADGGPAGTTSARAYAATLA